ncbi:Crp/Fnr family transcriptional regulator [Hyphococcus sp.]|jgi:CRP-like cAMP-binding protein|uniref:Crp/Fnr family transcriptional regulator n=1 Tax=Hyphococcus sp. TaxID=2038636 RepID=UPI003D13DA11
MEALFRRLSYYADLGEEELTSLKGLRFRVETYQSGEEIVARGEDPGDAFVVSTGWAARYISLEDGRSQILNFMLPGDVYDLQVFVTNGADHSVLALNKVTVLEIKRQEILSLFMQGGRSGAAFWWCTLQEEAILREQIVRNGRRSARERVAHLLLELHRRAVIAGEGAGHTFHMPVSQAMLADALGLSFVHINRVLRELEKTGVIERTKGRITLLQRDRLVEICDFQDDYLHLEDNPRRLGFNF